LIYFCKMKTTPIEWLALKQTMSEQLTLLLSQYGYIAIIALIFLQEVGIPSPIPNEFVLVFSGYLAFTGVLNISWVILSAIVGDLLASFILFEAFYFFGKLLMERKPKWIPISKEKMDKLNVRIQESGQTGTFVGRLTPFIKGYVSVLSGLLRISQKKYGMTLLSTSIIWSAAYASLGYFMGPHLTKYTSLLFIIPTAAFVVFLISHFLRKKITV